MGALLGLGADFPELELDTDFDAVRDGPLMETRFVGLSSGAGEAGLFFPPTLPGAVATLLDDVGSARRLATGPPLIFSANNFLHPTKQCVRMAKKSWCSMDTNMSTHLPKDFSSVLPQINHVDVFLGCIVACTVVKDQRDVVFKVFWRICTGEEHTNN